MDPEPQGNADGDALTYAAAWLPAGLVLNPPACRGAVAAASTAVADGNTAPSVLTALNQTDRPLTYEAAGLPPGLLIDPPGG